ncbi:hypothetical protein SCUCBS95973_001136 [Sporothrix curviconia]|uniref:NAD-dependent epimerase/dehydratase domain-containing protein n=1 Tax=Sporothrix curviconia TaxID=1260050 RepID=A0ABP0AWI2_9PEZI
MDSATAPETEVKPPAAPTPAGQPVSVAQNPLAETARATAPVSAPVSAPISAPVSTENSNASTTVLVTGGTGFIASHLILQLLGGGYSVRATLRSLAKEAGVRESLSAAFTSTGADAASHLDRLTVVAADLDKDDCWADAVRGCTYVHHVASPFPATDPKTEDEVIGPAREGALRVLRAAQEATTTVQRVVLTSSFAAISYGHPPSPGRVFTEKDWSVDGPGLPAYHKSKLLAERAAWEYVQSLPEPEQGSGRDKNIELVVINPVGTFGPVLPGTAPSPSVSLVRGLLDDTASRFMIPQLYFNMVDVRDVADLHMRAMTVASSVVGSRMKGQKGQQPRFLAVADGRPTSLEAIAMAIRKERPQLAKARGVPTLTAPNWMVRAAAIFDSKARSLVPLLGAAAVRVASNEKAKQELGWRPRPIHETILATVDSLIEAEEAQTK